VTLSPLSTACLQRVLLALLTLLSPLQLAGAAMTARATGVEVPADFGEEIHTGEEATARVLSVREAGAVEQGAGHVVTGTFQTWNADVRELWMEGLEAPVRVTGGHRFYSASRGWVEAHRLAVGETVRTRDGSGARVLGLERLPGVHAVFNLEVEGLHQYYVSPLGLLAHNNSKCETTNTSAQKTKGANEAAETSSDLAESSSGISKIDNNIEIAVDTKPSGGRSGKQQRLKELGEDPKVSAADRGWIKNEQRHIKTGNRDTIRVPPGKDLAHERGREAAKGFGYKHSNLQDRSLHRLQHRFDNFGKKNKRRPTQ
jgi:hypothetical protein